MPLPSLTLETAVAVPIVSEPETAAAVPMNVQTDMPREYHEVPVTNSNTARIEQLKQKLTSLLKCKKLSSEEKSNSETSLPNSVQRDANEHASRINSAKRWNVWTKPPDTSTSVFIAENSSDSRPTKKSKTEGSKSISSLVCLELCAGSANLSRALHNAGFQVIAVDHQSNVHKPKVHIVQIDLSHPSAFELISTFLQDSSVFYVHIAPPCGTASAARNKPVDPKLVAAGFPNPPPLMSKDHPLGLPGLSVLNQTRVRLANDI